MPYIAEILFLMIQVWVADYQSQQFDAGKSISHTLWAAIMGAIIVVAWYICGKDYWLALALVLERTWSFNPILNLFRSKPFFYTNSGKGGSWMDAHIGNRYPYIFVISLAGFIYLQFIV